MATTTMGIALTDAGDTTSLDAPARVPPDGPPDEPPDLRRRFAAGDPAAFDQVVAVYQPRVARLAYRLLGWRGAAADVEDVVQDVFLAALTRARSFRGRSSLWTWLTAITLNRCRRHARRAALFERFRTWAGRQAGREEPTADRRLLEGEASARVRTAVAALPPRDREVVVLYYLEGRTGAELSELLGAPAGAVNVRLHRARQKLKQSLAGLVEE